jgi:hypothetical protein
MPSASKGKGKVGASGPPHAPIPVPATIPVASAEISISITGLVGPVASSGGISPAKRSVPPSLGTEVATVNLKRRRATKSDMLLFLGFLTV